MVDRLLSIEWRADEWDESAENEPEVDADYESWQSQREACEAGREWAQALTDETEDDQC